MDNQSSRELIFYGMGGHASTILNALPDADIKGYFSDSQDSSIIQWLGPYNTGIHSDKEIVIAIGNNRLREEILNTIAHKATIVIAPNALITTQVLIEDGAVILSGAIVQPNVKIKKGAIINAGCIIDHDTEIGICAHISSGAVIGSRSKIGNRVLVGVGAVVPPGSIVPDDSVVTPGMTYL